uniref:Histone-lysine N-methyltransferase n=1 Tax=Heterorhabditis bacteriophora TaxID=37862 RepID=A0A1I7XFK3_HETBA
MSDPVVDSFRAMIGMVRCAPAHYFDKLDLLLPEPSFPPSPLSSPHSETNKENGIELETIQNSDVERRGRSKKARARGTISDTTDLNCNATKDGRRHSQPTTPTTTIHLANEKGTKNGMLAKVHRFCSNIDLKVESNIKHKPAPKITTRTRMKNEAYGKTNSGAQCISGRTRTVQLTGVSGDASANYVNICYKIRDSSAESVATSSASRDSSTENVSDHGKKSKCFVCREAGNQKLLQCSKKYPGGGICSTRFHDDCLKTYNAGDFNADYVCELFDIKGEDTFVCPLHHCDLCYFERKKCTAVTGAMIQCSKCYRAFHEVCRPAGGVVKQEKCLLTGEDSSKIEVKLQTTICHVHSREEHAKIISNSRSHLPFCCECEEKGKEALLKCSQCIRSYHQRCRTVDLIEGNRYPPEKPICEGCIHGESLRIGQHVIAKFQNTFYAGTCVTLDEYPEHCASADKYGKHLGEPGFVALTWAGCHNLFSLLPARTLVPMFQGSFHLIGKRMSDRDHYNAWLEMDQNIVIPRPERETVQDRYTKVKTSVYHKDCQKPRLNSVDESDVMCDCMESEPDRCGPGSKCTNRAVHQECPESCEKRPGGCQNRSLSRRETNPNIVVMKTKGKGDGVFAKRRIPKDSFIAEYAGEIISLREKNRRIALSAKSKNDEEKHYMMALDNHRVIDCKKKGNVARFLNHSCDPNCKVDTLDVVVASNKQGKSTFVKYDKRVRITTIKEIEPEPNVSVLYDIPDSKQMTFQNHYFPVHGIEQVEPNPFIDEASKQTYIDKIKSKATIPSVPRDEEVEEELVLFTPRKPGDELVRMIITCFI